MVDALRMSMNSTSIQPPNQLMQQSQDINKEGNGERVCNTKYVKILGYLWLIPTIRNLNIMKYR